jgi:glutamate racemase
MDESVMQTEMSHDGGPARLPYVVSPPLQPSPTPHERATLPLSGPVVTPRAIAAPTILVFDSGLGGLTVFREVAKARPDATFVYAADDALFPYGRMPEADLAARVVSLMGDLIGTHRPDLVVIACNTASTLVLPALRRHFTVPFVGTVPAIKPACAASQSKRVAVLGTEATVTREYTRALIRQYGQGCRVNLIGSAWLAGYAERELSGEPVPDALLAAEIAPCFVDEGGARTDTVVLACTHYPLLAERLATLAPWPVRWIDPAPAIARRVVGLIGAPQGKSGDAPARAVFTSGRNSPALAHALAGFGIDGLLSEPARDRSPSLR